MIATNNKKIFFKNEVSQLLQKLSTETEPNFGLMTAQHMIEHLTWTFKSAVKRSGEPEETPSKSQLKIHYFLEKGAIFKHFPSEKTKADLPPLKYETFEEAVKQIPVAINRFYDHFEANPDFKAYNKFFGEIGFEKLELFHYMHFRYHFWQFGLIENYPEGS